MTVTQNITVGVLALQGGVVEHINLLRKAAPALGSEFSFTFNEVRMPEQLAKCDALIIPGGESTTMAIVARRLGLMDPLKDFVKVQKKPVWGTCAGLVMLAEQASATKQGGQELIGGLGVRVLRNRYGTQIQSFVASLDLPFLASQSGENGTGESAASKPFRAVFIRAPVVEEIIVDESAKAEEEAGAAGKKEPVEVLGVCKDDVVAVRQGNVFGTSFHPELTDDVRIHVWWLKQVVDSVRHGKLVVQGA